MNEPLDTMDRHACSVDGRAQNVTSTVRRAMAAAEHAVGLRIATVALNELLMLQRDAARGDAYSRYMAEVAIAMVLKVNNAPADRPARCIFYSETIRRGDRYFIGIILPSPDARFLLCDGCGVAPVTLGAVMRALTSARGPCGLVRPDRTSWRGGRT